MASIYKLKIVILFLLCLMMMVCFTVCDGVDSHGNNSENYHKYAIRHQTKFDEKERQIIQEAVHAFQPPPTTTSMAKLSSSGELHKKRSYHPDSSSINENHHVRLRHNNNNNNNNKLLHHQSAEKESSSSSLSSSSLSDNISIRSHGNQYRIGGEGGGEGGGGGGEISATTTLAPWLQHRSSSSISSQNHQHHHHHHYTTPRSPTTLIEKHLLNYYNKQNHHHSQTNHHRQHQHQHRHHPSNHRPTTHPNYHKHVTTNPKIKNNLNSNQHHHHHHHQQPITPATPTNDDLDESYEDADDETSDNNFRDDYNPSDRRKSIEKTNYHENGKMNENFDRISESNYDEYYDDEEQVDDDNDDDTDDNENEDEGLESGRKISEINHLQRHQPPPPHSQPSQHYKKAASLASITPSSTTSRFQRHSFNDDSEEIYSPSYIPGSITNLKQQTLGTHEAVVESRRSYYANKAQERELAMAHARKMRRETECRWPRPKVIAVRNDPEKTYSPQCTILHRCGEDTGCCKDSKICVAKNFTNIDLYFFVSAVGRRTETEKLTFRNDTECYCEERKTNINSSPAPILSCNCIEYFEQTILPDGTCHCDCSPNNEACNAMKRGLEHISSKDRICIRNGECERPTCEYGNFNASTGRCPRIEDKISDSRRLTF